MCETWRVCCGKTTVNKDSINVPPLGIITQNLATSCWSAGILLVDFVDGPILTRVTGVKVMSQFGLGQSSEYLVLVSFID